MAEMQAQFNITGNHPVTIEFVDYDVDYATAQAIVDYLKSMQGLADDVLARLKGTGSEVSFTHTGGSPYHTLIWKSSDPSYVFELKKQG